ncbi:MAG: MotA/TolQ/ExbB proton channel family protein [Pirellulaceae bacterium]
MFNMGWTARVTIGIAAVGAIVCLVAPSAVQAFPAVTIVQDAGNAPLENEAIAQSDGVASQLSAPESMNILALLFKGGWFMIPLLLVSLAVAALIVERTLMLRRNRLFPDRLVRRLGQLSDMPGGMDPREAYKICQNNPSTASDIMKRVLVKVGRPQSELEASLHETSQRHAIETQQTSSWLTLAAAIAPLIGLLGTVWGITQAFYDTTQLPVGQNRAEALSEGIYTALVTTICGLVIAIPATVASHYFDSRIVKVFNQIEAMILDLLPQFERYEGQVRFTDGEEFAATKHAGASRRDGASSGDESLPRPRHNTTEPVR